jgi:hypothetical protein
MKKVSAQYTNDTISSYYRFLVAGDRNLRWHVHVLYTGAVQEPLGGLWLDYGAIATHQNYFCLPTTRVLIVGQSRRLRHEIILFRDARGPRSRDSVVFDGGFVIAHPFK